MCWTRTSYQHSLSSNPGCAGFVKINGMCFFGIIVSDRLYKKVRQSATVAVCEVMTLYLERNVYISVVVVVVSIVGV